YRLTFDNTILAWDGEGRQVEVRVVNLKLLTPEGRTVAGAPQMAIGLNGAALLRGRFELRSVELIEPKGWLVRREDGRVDLGLGEADGDGGASLFAALAEGETPAFARGLRRLSVADADLWIEDRASRAVWRLPESDLVVGRTVEGMEVELSSATVLDGRR